MNIRWRNPDAVPAGPVTAVELFFDLVFAFTLTQLTRTLEQDLTLGAVGRLLLVFAPLWYMYGGYAWLTNHVPPRIGLQKLVLFAGMAGFFLAAVGIPRAFGNTALLFGVGYLVVVCIHLLLFTQSDALLGVLRLAPFNLVGALLILAAAFAHGAAVYLLWLAGYLLMAVAPYLLPRLSWVGVARAFHVEAGHFVERHSLLVLIALGESVIAIGMAVDVDHVTLGTVGVILLALMLPGAMWWTYFTDYHAAEHALGARTDGIRSMLATRAYYFGHIPILLGIVCAAAGIHSAMAHPAEPAAWPAATALAGGVALFLAGIADLRQSMSFASPAPRLLAAVAVLASIPIGAIASARVQLAIVLGIVVVMLVGDRREAAITLSHAEAAERS